MHGKYNIINYCYKLEIFLDFIERTGNCAVPLALLFLRKVTSKK